MAQEQGLEIYGEAEPEQPQREAVPWTWRDAAAIFVLTVLVGIVLTAEAGASSRSLLVTLVGVPLAESILPLVTALVLGLLTLGYIRLRYPGHVRMLFGPAPPSRRALVSAGPYALLALAINFGVLTLVSAFAARSGGELPVVQEEFRQAAQTQERVLWLAAAAVVFAPLAEELFFRGVLFQALRRRLDVWPAIGMSALAFALVHAQGTLEGTGLVFLVIFPLGMLLAWAFQRRGTLLTPVAVHALFNLVGVVLLRLA